MREREEPRTQSPPPGMRARALLAPAVRAVRAVGAVRGGRRPTARTRARRRRYAAEVLSAKDAESVVVVYDALYQRAGAGAAPSKEDVSSQLVRPKPPEPPSDWAAKLQPGSAVELRHEEGWWQCQYVAKQAGVDKALVSSSHWGTRHLVGMSALRPGWKWAVHGSEWSLLGQKQKEAGWKGDCAPPRSGGGGSGGGGRGRDMGCGGGRGGGATAK